MTGKAVANFINSTDRSFMASMHRFAQATPPRPINTAKSLLLQAIVDTAQRLETLILTDPATFAPVFHNNSKNKAIAYFTLLHHRLALHALCDLIEQHQTDFKLHRYVHASRKHHLDSSVEQVITTQAMRYCYEHLVARLHSRGASCQTFTI